MQHSRRNDPTIKTGVRRDLVISKQDLLLFDDVVVLGLEEQIEEAESIDPQTAANAIYLAEKGVLHTAPSTNWEIRTNPHFVQPLIEKLNGDDLPEETEALLRLVSSAGHPSNPIDSRLPPGGEAVISWLLNVMGASTVPLLEHRPSAADWDRLRQSLWLPPSLVESGTDDTLLEVVLDKMPIPGPDVPLHEVLDFSQDPETIRRRRRLLRALERAEIEGTSPETFNLNLEDALSSYQDHMKLADMRSRTSALRVLVDASLGVVEELVHLSPRGALNAVFEYRKLRADRFEAELKAPGGEVAYIYDAEQQFPPRM